jgi:16S rRNA (guanine966-N2)-methyltransferase
MRVVSGTARGRPLQAPPGRSTRPTSDRVREAVFNALGSLGAVEGASVLDLFAGSGALGIEALSRGAAQATFVDSDRRAVEVVRANLEATGLAGRATVVRGDALGHLAGAAPVDLALLDPPYAFDGWEALLAALPAVLVVAESDREIPVGERWEVLRARRYGGTVVTLLRRREPERPL